MLNKRIKFAGAVYHCIGRIVGGEIVMGDEEKEYFRKLMWRLADFCGVEVMAYCVMGNHVHLLVKTPESGEVSDEELCRRMIRYYGRREPWVQLMEQSYREGGVFNRQMRERLLARMGDVTPFMQTLKQRLTRWYNRRHKRFGTLWAERFKSLLVQDSTEALRTVAMYIDLNPVRAGLVKDPKDYRFCSHAEAVVGNAAIRRSTVALCDGGNWKTAQAEYRQVMLVYAGYASGSGKVALDPQRIRQVLEKGGKVSAGEVLRLRIRYLSDGLVFGSREFVEEVFEEFRDRFGGRRRTGARVMRRVGAALGDLTTVRDLKSGAVK